MTTDMTSLAQVQAWLPQAQLDGAPEPVFRRVHTDSRSIEPGDLFVALRGERFDGSEFLAQAQALGAVAAICANDSQSQARLRAAGLPGLLVPDSQVALTQLAGAWRGQFALPLIAVTGSNGKTTVTQMMAAILQSHQPQAHLATQGNFNNAIGVPLTLLRLRPWHQIAVLELGMNHPGEIAQLAALAAPSVALVNNAQREHMEFMGSVAAVALENGQVISALPAHGTAVFPADDAFSALWHQLAAPRKVCNFGATSDVHCQEATWLGQAWQVRLATPLGPLSFRLQAAGQHNLHNAMAAVAGTLAAGVPRSAIAAGLNAFLPVKGRSQVGTLHLAGRTITVVDDSYNANPDSVRAAIAVLAGLPAPRLLVLGDMGEVGQQGAQFHAEAARLAHSLGIESLLTLGNAWQVAAQHFGAARHFADMPALQAAVLEALPRTASVLVKGSRFMQMERVIAAIYRHAATLASHA
jgi:UDP-N-acetylmuramoyl-tripeptide--D-alanyl-D-alanine ligase